MKIFILTITFLCCLGLKSNAQEVQKNYINYQGVANDASGNAIANTGVNIQLALKLGSTTAVASYIENHTVTTTDKGMFSLQIGAGTLVAGNYTTIVWGNDAVFLTVSINGAEIGTTELVAVPYALSSGDNQWSVSGNTIENKNTGTVSITNNLEVGTTLQLENGVAINEFSTDTTLDGNSDAVIPTEKAIKTYVDTNGSSGLETLNEGNGIGWRLKDRNLDNYGNLGLEAVDFSSSNLASVTYGATGNFSAAFGFITQASGAFSTAIGRGTIASGNCSFAQGFASNAVGDYSASLGFGSDASGEHATATGYATDAIGENSLSAGYISSAEGNNAMALGTRVFAKSFGEIALGMYNTNYSINSTTDWNANDKILVVGNGTSTTARNDALVIYKNGNAEFDAALEVGTTLKLENGSTINEFSTDATLNDNSDTAIPTEKAVKTYVDASSSTGLESLNEGNGLGWRLKGRNSNNYGNIGFGAVDFSNSTAASVNNGATGSYSTAFGSNTIASGLRSIAMGNTSEATGNRSIAVGWSTKSAGVNSVAMGFSSEATGATSTAIGSNVIASGDYAAAFGRYTLARSYGEVVVGSYNTDYTPNSTTSWSSSDRVFVVGNGTSTTNKSDALTIYKNGRIKLEEEVNRLATGNADLLPVAYGTVSSSGATVYGTGNFTVNRQSNVYTISVNGEGLYINTGVTSVVPYSSTSPAFLSVSYSGGDLVVRSFNSVGGAAPVSFQFVIYKL